MKLVNVIQWVIAIAHWIDFDLLKKSFKALSKNESTGVDKITAKGYAADLDENLYNLYEIMRNTA